MDFSRYVYLDESSPTGLRWVNEGGRGISKHYSGGVAGVKQESQAYRIWLDGSFYKVHRIVFEMYHELILSDGEVVDHYDGNPFNNRISNLRPVSRKINSQNMKMNVNNKTGHTGVQVNTTKSGFTYATATWRNDQSKKASKSFSFLKYGEELAILMAIEYRLHIIDQLNCKGAGYTIEHGVR